MRRHLTSLLLSTLLIIAPPAALAQNGTFISAGLELHYRSAGTGTHAVLLSGGPGFTVDYMVPVGDFLPADYRRIFLEQRGTGKSRPASLSPETMTLETVVEDLEALRLHLKQDRMLLIGHSYGMLFGDLAKRYDLRDGLKKLTRPVLIVQGHQDPIGDKTAEDIHALIQGSTLAYVNKAGHFPWLEQPEEFKRIVVGFLGKP